MMKETHRGVFRAFLLAFLIVFGMNAAHAGWLSKHWGRGPFGGNNGKHIHEVLTAPAHHWGQGPFAGRNGAHIHNSLMHAEKAIGTAGTVVWQTSTRPFVETWKFVTHPFSGIKRSLSQAYMRAMNDLNNLVQYAIKWLSIGLATIISFSVGLAMGFAALFFRPRKLANA